MALLSGVASAQQTTRVSVDSAGAEANDDSEIPAVSADGQSVAFFSYASNLVAGDTNGFADVFLHDRNSGLTERISVDSAGAEANGDSYGSAITADGQIVAFYSFASNLVSGDTNGLADVFVRDRSTGVTELVSVDSSGVQGDGHSFSPAISADGRIVAFWGNSSNFAGGDTNGFHDVFVHDRVTGLTERVSVDSSGTEGDLDSAYPTISADGQFVAFLSTATNLVAGDTNGSFDAFVHDRATGLTDRVSVDSSGAEANDHTLVGVISADGTTVALGSLASNLVAGDSNGYSDVFVHDRASGLTELVSVDSSGAQGNSFSDAPAISADGQIVVFTSLASNLVSGDTNGTNDVFVHDRTHGLTKRVSVDSSNAEANDHCYLPSMSADGRAVAFYGPASNLVAGDTNAYYDVFVHDLCTDATWTNYGTGFAGTNGIPSFTSQADPVLGTTVTLDLASSANAASVAFVFVGYSEALVPTSKGGDLLVTPALTLVMPLPTTGTTIAGDLPDDEALCGFEVFAQALELDPGAKKGVSFTAGLKLVLGR